MFRDSKLESGRISNPANASGYPLVNVYIANWKITMLLIAKSTISMAMFNSYHLVMTNIAMENYYVQ